MPSAENKKRHRSRWFDDLVEEDEDPIQMIVDRVLDSRQANNVIDSFRSLLDRAGNAIDPKNRPPRPSPQAPEGRRIRPSPFTIARSIMHFGPAETLTIESITKRRRELATFCHPDKGGSPEAMVKLNQAADCLLQGLKDGLY